MVTRTGWSMKSTISSTYSIHHMNRPKLHKRSIRTQKIHGCRDIEGGQQRHCVHYLEVKGKHRRLSRQRHTKGSTDG
jgi:hypothetical protein